MIHNGVILLNFDVPLIFIVYIYRKNIYFHYAAQDIYIIFLYTLPDRPADTY